MTATDSGHIRVWNPAGERLSNDNWSAGENLLCMRLEPGLEPTTLATGGRENPLKIWDIATERTTFTAKNVCSFCKFYTTLIFRLILDLCRFGLIIWS